MKGQPMKVDVRVRHLEATIDKIEAELSEFETGDAGPRGTLSRIRDILQALKAIERGATLSERGGRQWTARQ